MTNFPGYKKLFEYDADSNRKILDFMLADNEPPPRAVKIFSHLINAEKMWQSRLELGVKSPAPNLWPKIATNKLADELEAVHGHWMRYLESGDGGALSVDVTYLNLKGEQVTKPAFDILTHVIAHSSYHRGQIASLAGNTERQAPFTDYIFFDG